MKPIPALVAISTAVMFFVGCGKKEAPTEEKKSAEPESHVKRGTNGDVVITLDTETQKRMGLEIATLAAAQFAPEVKVVGRALDPATVSALVGDFISARATADASAKELERAKTLAKNDNFSARALQTAEAAAARDAALMETARAKTIGTLGKDLAARENLVELAKSLASETSALVRLDLPPGESSPGEVTSARLMPLREGNKFVEGKFVGATAVDTQSQSRGLLFLIESNTYGLTAGEVVTGFVKITGEPQSGVNVPRSAIVRKDGAAWVYILTGDSEFTRREISTERPSDNGYFVSRGVNAGEKAVTIGAQQLLSEELKGQIGGD
jgi:hypothetical protein